MLQNPSRILLTFLPGRIFSFPVYSFIKKMHVRPLLFSAVLLTFFSPLSNSQSIKPETARTKLVNEIDSILLSQVALDKIPGAVIEIKKDNRVIYRHAYGYACKYDYNHQLLNPPEKMTVDHLFDIASLTKVIGTTTSVMLLADRGLINVEDPVYKYIKLFDHYPASSYTYGRPL